MSDQSTQSPTPLQEVAPPPPERSLRWVGWSSLFFAFIQSICSAFVVLSGLRLLLGAAALASAVGAMQFIDNRLHIDAIRIPMMILALAGALFNLVALWQVRRLRNRTASAWRQKEVGKMKKNSELWQFVLSIATLVLLGIELLYHFKFNGHF